MSIYNYSGSSLQSCYSEPGSSLQNAYDVSGNIVFTASGSSYTETITQAASIWRTEYLSDNTMIPLVLSTDQHSYLNASHGKILYDYLSTALTWNEISASLNLGDVCAGYYNTTELGNMLTAFANIPIAKQINIMGNHDVWASSNTVISNETFTDAMTYYFNNTNYPNDSRFENRGVEVMIDTAHNVKYIVIACWYFPDDVYYHYTIPGDALDFILTQLSTVDNYDIIVLSHIQPLGSSRTWYYPPVDGNEFSYETKSLAYSNVAPYGSTGLLEGLIAARKNKTSGTVYDSEGVAHSYDFSSCTSDALCWLCGHAHTDEYAYDKNNNEGIVPIIIFDAYRYDYHPFYLINVDRTNEMVRIYKVDDSPTIYSFNVPFSEVTP